MIIVNFDSFNCRKVVYKFINKLLKASDTNDPDMENLCLTLLNLEQIEEDRLESWIELAIFRPLSTDDSEVS